MAAIFPSGEKAMLSFPQYPQWKRCSGWPSETRQICTDPLDSPAASRLPSEEKATLNTAASVGQKATCSRVLGSYSVTPREEPKATRRPSDDQATALRVPRPQRARSRSRCTLSAVMGSAGVG